MSRGGDLHRKAQHTVPMHALARLIKHVMAAQSWNQAEIGRRTGMSSSRVSQLIRDPVKAIPDRDTVADLARGLGLPPWVVMDAYLESAGFPTRPNHIGITEAVASDVHLSAGDKRAILAFVDHIRAQPTFDLADVEGIRLAEDEEPVRDTNRNGTVR